MSLQDEGFRYYISPNKDITKWMPPEIKETERPDWVDITDMPDDELVEWLKS